MDTAPHVRVCSHSVSSCVPTAHPPRPPTRPRSSPKPRRTNRRRAVSTAPRRPRSACSRNSAGSEQSEEAVMLGLAWLTQMQKKEGNWEYDAGGQSRPRRSNGHGRARVSSVPVNRTNPGGTSRTVQAGLDWLVKHVNMGQGADPRQVRPYHEHVFAGHRHARAMRRLRHDPGPEVERGRASRHRLRSKGARQERQLGIHGWQDRRTHPSSAGRCRRFKLPSLVASMSMTMSSRKQFGF